MSTSGLGLTYEYFANGWLKAVKMGNDTIAEYEYDQVGNRTGINLGNGTHTGYTYDGDPRYRVSGIGHYNGQTLLGSISYLSRDGSGNPLEMVVGNTGVTYTYDMNSRLWKVTYSGQPQITHEYDWVGNRLVPGSAQYNAADQLTSGFGHTYNYDGRGNMTSSVGANGKTYTYTPANLLSSVTHDEVQGSPVSSMTWDGDSNRVSFTRSTGGTWQFVYDPTAGIPAVIEEVKDGVSVYYLREPGGALIARISGGDIHYYHFDALGSTRLLTDGSGAITDEYSYDAWGNVSHDTGSTEQPYQFVGQLGYYTHWQDENLDLLQLGVRFYDPETGRFTQADPIRDGGNWYLYVGSNPIAAVDPRGLKSSKRTACEMKCNQAFRPEIESCCEYDEFSERLNKSRDDRFKSGCLSSPPSWRDFFNAAAPGITSEDTYDPRSNPRHPLNATCVAIPDLGLGPARGREGLALLFKRMKACNMFSYLRDVRGRSPLWKRDEFICWWEKYYSQW